MRFSTRTFIGSLIIIAACLVSLATYAQTKAKRPATANAAQAQAEQMPSFTKGSGAEYQLTVGKDPIAVTIAFVDPSSSKLVIEVAMKSLNDKPSANIRMVQQFHLGLDGGKIKILKGIMQIPMISKPQILPPEYLEGYDGVQVKSFLIGSNKDLDAKKIGVEEVSTNAGTFRATHYQHVENNQTVDFWLSDQAKPLGLVKLESSGVKSGQGYKMIYQRSLSGVTAQINADEAEPLNDAAKMFLPLLIPGMLHP